MFLGEWKASEKCHRPQCTSTHCLLGGKVRFGGKMGVNKNLVKWWNFDLKKHTSTSSFLDNYYPHYPYPLGPS